MLRIINESSEAIFIFISMSSSSLTRGFTKLYLSLLRFILSLTEFEFLSRFNVNIYIK